MDLPKYHFYVIKDIPSSEEDKRRLMEDINGRIVILGQTHSRPFLMRGQIEYNLCEPEFFYLRSNQGRMRKEKFRRVKIGVDDVEVLMVEDDFVSAVLGK